MSHNNARDQNEANLASRRRRPAAVPARRGNRGSPAGQRRQSASRRFAKQHKRRMPNLSNSERDSYSHPNMEHRAGQ
jgi:hypothetical protein